MKASACSQPVPPPSPQAEASKSIWVVSLHKLPPIGLYTLHTCSALSVLPTRKLYASTSVTTSKKASLITCPHFLQLFERAPMSLPHIEVRTSDSGIKKKSQRGTWGTQLLGICL